MKAMLHPTPIPATITADATLSSCGLAHTCLPHTPAHLSCVPLHVCTFPCVYLSMCAQCRDGFNVEQGEGLWKKMLEGPPERKAPGQQPAAKQQRAPGFKQAAGSKQPAVGSKRAASLEAPADGDAPEGTKTRKRLRQPAEEVREHAGGEASGLAKQCWVKGGQGRGGELGETAALAVPASGAAGTPSIQCYPVFVFAARSLLPWKGGCGEGPAVAA